MNKLIDLAMKIRCDMHSLKEFVQLNGCKISERLNEEWIDSQRVMNILIIKKRALQNLRDNGMLPFSIIHGKLYYKIKDVEGLLKTNYVKKGNRP
jgi:hypothetical protein